MVTRSKIAKYWFDKGINKETFEVVQIEKDTDFGEVGLVILDWGEPECWACGKSIAEEQPGVHLTISKIWNACKLERCHIIARQFGGSDEVSNLFLLCPKCHHDSPDTRNTENFFAWVMYKRKMGGYIQDYIIGIKEAASMKHTDIEALSQTIDKKLFETDSQMQMAKGIIKNCGYHGAKVVDSTLFMSFIDEMKKMNSQ